MTTFEYYYMGFTVFILIMLCVVFIIMHSHVWIRNGYMGINKVLELNEVDRFVAHVIAEAGLVIWVCLILMEPLVVKYIQFNFPEFSKAGTLSFSFGGGVYMALKGLKPKKVNEDS